MEHSSGSGELSMVASLDAPLSGGGGGGSHVYASSPQTPFLRGGELARKYCCSKSEAGFLDFLESEEYADVVVEVGTREYRLHRLLLAHRSEFFRRAFSGGFSESSATEDSGQSRLKLRIEDDGGVFDTLISFIYTGSVTLSASNCLALLSLARQLLIPTLQEFCADFAQNSLEASNALQYLAQAVQYNCEPFRASCVALVAEGFPSTFDQPTAGLPVEVMVEVLEHPELNVQAEEQVLAFVVNYVQAHELAPEVQRSLFRLVRFPFLSNARLAALASSPGGGPVPADLLLGAMAARLQLIDHPERMAAPAAAAAAAAAAAGGGAAAAQPPLPPPAPRKTYCCTVEYGLPGGHAAGIHVGRPGGVPAGARVWRQRGGRPRVAAVHARRQHLVYAVGRQQRAGGVGGDCVPAQHARG